MISFFQVFSFNRPGTKYSREGIRILVIITQNFRKTHIKAILQNNKINANSKIMKNSSNSNILREHQNKIEKVQK